MKEDLLGLPDEPLAFPQYLAGRDLSERVEMRSSNGPLRLRKPQVKGSSPFVGSVFSAIPATRAAC